MYETDRKNKIAIRLVGIHKTYVMGEVKVPVLKGIDLEIYRGQFTVILGASGAGKSTLLNMIGGIDRPTSGEVWFGGENIAGFSDKELTLYRRRSVGFVFQFYNLVATLTARENVEVSTEIAPDPMDPVKALEEVELGDRIDHFPAQMSGGQQQRVAIARAIAKNPGLMLCDEPTGALDADTTKIVLNLLSRLNKTLGATLVLITHAPQIARMAHRVVRIADGVIADVHINDNPLTADQLSWTDA